MAEVKHTGEVVRIEGGGLYVKMRVNSACSECHARGVCGVDEAKEKIVEVESNETAEYELGEIVEVALQSGTMGAKSVILAYVVPFFVLTLVLVGAVMAGAREGVAVLSSLAAVGLYYVVLYFMQNRIKREIKFKIIKQTK